MNDRGPTPTFQSDRGQDRKLDAMLATLRTQWDHQLATEVVGLLMSESRWEDALSVMESDDRDIDSNWFSQRARCLFEMGQFRAVNDSFGSEPWTGVAADDLVVLSRALAKIAGPHAAVRPLLAAIVATDAKARHHLHLGRAFEGAGAYTQAKRAYRSYIRRRQGGGRPYLQETGGSLHLEKAISLGLLDRPGYAYALYRTALMAGSLGIESFRAIEFGVAAGRGLIQLERHAELVAEATGIGIEIVGCDTGEGLPPPEDYRDVPHYFAGGDYPMDLPKLRKRLTRASLIIGDARVTVAKLLVPGPPIGVLLFDMDTYQSTKAVLQQCISKQHDAYFLPRVACVFDDVVPKRPSEFLKDYSEGTGERLAISEANFESNDNFVSPDLYFESVPLVEPWHKCAFLMHRVTHPHYATNLGVSNPNGLSLR